MDYMARCIRTKGYGWSGPPECEKDMTAEANAVRLSAIGGRSATEWHESQRVTDAASRRAVGQHYRRRDALSCRTEWRAGCRKDRADEFEGSLDYWQQYTRFHK